MSSPSPTSPPPLLTVRSALILFLALVAGAVAGGLTRLGGNSWPEAVLAGGAAAAAALALFQSLIA